MASSNRITASVNNITTYLHMARSEAVKRGVGVVVCPSTDGIGCSDTIRWDYGLIIYADSNNNRIRDPDEEILKYINTDHDSILISSTPGRKKTVYNSHGHVRGYNLTLTFCDSTNLVDPKAVIVSNSGKVRVSSTNSKGGPLNCS
jgi:type IV fimbrial biogenesis protein FimT